MAVAVGGGPVRFSEHVLTNYGKVCSVMLQLIRRVSRDQMDNPTPCPPWTVRDLINHVVQVNELYGDTVTGRTGRPHSRVDDRFLSGAFGLSVEHTAEAFMAEEVLRGSFDDPFAPVSIAATVQHCTDDLLVHAWDLARATGQSTDLLPEVARECLRVLQAWRHLIPRNTGVYAPERPAPAGSSPADQLAAFLGRTV